MRRAGWRGGFGFAMLSLAAVALCAVLGVSAYNEVKDIRRAVSYTHLDVYKRQATGRGASPST